MRPTSDLHRLAARTVLIAFDGTSAPRWLVDAVETAGYAGVVLFGSNIGDDDQVAALTRQLAAASPDVIVSVDEEGGDVTRLGYAHGSLYPGNAALGAVDDVELTAGVYGAMGADLGALGVTLDFAPSADINSAADNPVIGTRSFGADPSLVTRHTVAAIDGLQRAGVAACVKHFPGHGATSVDSHFDVPTVDEPLEVLRARELAPFRAAVEAGVAAVMTAHVRVPALTGDLPATISRTALHDLLRTELGFDGAIVTDSMEMTAIRGTVGMAEGAVLALAAGADLLCTGGQLRGPDVVEPMVAAIVEAVRSGRLPEARLVDAAGRAQAVAHWRGRRHRDDIVEADGRQVGLAAARRAVTLLSGSRVAITRPLVVELQAPPSMAVGTVPWGLTPHLESAVPGTERRRVNEETADADLLVTDADGGSLIVVTRDAHRFPWQQKLVDELTARRADVIVVEMGLPIWRPQRAAAYVATYGAGRSNALAAAELLLRRRRRPSS